MPNLIVNEHLDHVAQGVAEQNLVVAGVAQLVER
jgi:hypothetical protein